MKNKLFLTLLANLLLISLVLLNIDKLSAITIFAFISSIIFGLSNLSYLLFYIFDYKTSKLSKTKTLIITIFACGLICSILSYLTANYVFDKGDGNQEINFFEKSSLVLSFFYSFLFLLFGHVLAQAKLNFNKD